MGYACQWSMRILKHELVYFVLLTLFGCYLLCFLVGRLLVCLLVCLLVLLSGVYYGNNHILHMSEHGDMVDNEVLLFV